MNIDKVVIKEIYDIPRTIEAIKNKLGDIKKLIQDVYNEGVDRVEYIGCGSSYYAALKSSYPLMYSPNKSPIKSIVLPASEAIWLHSRYRHSKERIKSAVVLFSRSGETAEIKVLIKTLGASKNSVVIGLTCNPESFLAKNSSYVISIKECAEESVYMTKSFVALALIGTVFSLMMLEVIEGTKLEDMDKDIESLRELSKILSIEIDKIAQLAYRIQNSAPIVILGAEDLYPIASEAALKFIEISYTNAIALHALEFRHGYTGVLENRNSSIIVLSNINSPSYTAIKNLYSELKSVGANVLSISNHVEADYTIETKRGSYIETIAYIIPLYYIAVLRALSLGYDPDRPKHIVKIVSKF